MTDLATLAIKVDSTEAGKAATDLDKLTAAGAKTEKAVDGVGNSAAVAAAKTRTAADAAEELAADMRLATAAVNQTKTAVDAANDNITRFGAQMNAVNGTSRAMRANFINLARQGQDVGTMFALGAPPMQIFASQGAQIADVLAMIKMEANATGTSLTRLALGGLAKLAPYAAVVAAIGGAFALLSDEVNENAEVQVSWKNTALGAYDAVAAALNDQVSAAFDALGINVGEVWTYIVDTTKTAANLIIGAASLAPRMIITAFKVLPAGIADVFFTAVNGGIRAINSLVERSVAAINGYAALVNPILEKVGLSIPKLLAPRIGEVENSYAGAAFAAAKAFTGTLTDTVSNNFIGDIADAIRPFAVARQLGEAAEETGKKAGKAAGRAMGKAAAEEYPKAFLDAIKDNARLVSENLEAAAKAFGDNLKRIKEEEDARESLRKEYQALIREMEIEQNLIGATAQERDIAALYLEREGFMARYAALGIEEATRMWEAYFAARKGLIDGQAAFDTEAANIQRLAGQLEGLAGMIGGRAGSVLGSILNLEIILADGTAEKLSETLSKAFGDGAGKLAASIDAALRGAQIGGSVGGLTGSSTGGSVGGAIGGFLGDEFLGPALGKLASGALGKALGALGGPLGSIAGGLIGGLIGGLVKSTPRASATIEVIGGEAMQTAIRGNSGKLKDVATGLANGLIGGLSQIADALGGELGSFGAISIGVRKDTFRVDPTGQGRTKNLPQFKTEEEAIAEALRIAISRGAITGIRAGTDALLRAGGDLETQLQKALAFEGVFDRLAEATDPLGFALGNLDKEFANLRKIFDEARASTEDYAALEQLYQIERNKLLEEFTDQVAGNTEAIRERMSLEARLLELQGDAAGALAIQRQLELDALDPANQEIARQIFALEDQAEALRIATEAANALAQAEAAIAQERFGLETRLLQLQGDTAALRERELAALDPSNRAILDRIFRLEDEQAAVQAAAEAAQELARIQDAIANERIGIENQILQLLGDTVAIRERELAAVDPANRALLQRLFDLQDEQAALEAVAAAQEEAARASEALAQEALRAADALAQAQRAIANEIDGLNRQLLQAQGNTAALRELDLAGLLSDDARAIQRQIFAIEDARAAQEALAEAQAEAAQSADELRRSTQDALRTAIAAERNIIEDRLAPLRSELERLVSAITPEAADITAALEARDFLTDGLALAQKLADASRGVLGDTERVIGAQRELARRELFRMVETRQINEDIIDRLIGDATAFGDNFATRVDLQREQGRTAGLLAELAKVAEENAKAAQAAEDARAAEARDQVLAQIAALQSQIAIGEAQLATLDATLERFGLLNDSVLSVADAVRQLESVTRQGFRIADPATATGTSTGDSLYTSGATSAPASGERSAMALPIEFLREINDIIFARQQNGMAIGAVDAEYFDFLTGDKPPLWARSLATIGGKAQLLLDQAGGDFELALQLAGQPKFNPELGVLPPANNVGQQMAAQSEATAANMERMSAEIVALREDLNAQMTAIARNTRETSDVLKRADGGDYVRFANDADTPVFTELVV